MAGLTLYKLTDSYNQVFDMVLDDDSDLATLEDTLQCIEGAIEQKIDNIGGLVKALEAVSGGYEKEMIRMEKRRNVIENTIKRIKNFAKMQLIVLKKDKVIGSLFTMRVQNNPPALEILDEKQIPTSFLTLEPERIIPAKYVPNKDLIKKTLMENPDLVIPGANLTRGNHLRIV